MVKTCAIHMSTKRCFSRVMKIAKIVATCTRVERLEIHIAASQNAIFMRKFLIVFVYCQQLMLISVNQFHYLNKRSAHYKTSIQSACKSAKYEMFVGNNKRFLIMSNVKVKLTVLNSSQPILEYLRNRLSNISLGFVHVNDGGFDSCHQFQ